MFNTKARERVPVAVELVPFDISLYATEDGLRALQNRFSLYLRGLSGPARFVALQTPADLSARIHYVGGQAHTAHTPEKRTMLHEYRRFYELLQARAAYQRSQCGLVLWAETGENPHTLAWIAGGGLEVPSQALDALPPVLSGRYALSAPDATCKYWHLRPGQMIANARNAAVASLSM